MTWSPIIYDWGPFVVVRAPDRCPPFGVLFREQRGRTAVLRLAMDLEKERLLDHLLQDPVDREKMDDAVTLELISWLRLELGDS